jgi:hypothetical protein
VPSVTERLNPVPKSWEPPAELLKKSTPKFNVGTLVRISEILANPETYYGQVLSVAGWARTVRSQ